MPNPQGTYDIIESFVSGVGAGTETVLGLSEV